MKYNLLAARLLLSVEVTASRPSSDTAPDGPAVGRLAPAPGAPLSSGAVPAADPHVAVRDAILAAYADLATAPARLLALLSDGAAWCDPYPTGCHHGKADIAAFLLRSMPKGAPTPTPSRCC